MSTLCSGELKTYVYGLTVHKENSAEQVQVLQSLTDQGQHCFLLILQILNITMGSKMYLLKF